MPADAKTGQYFSDVVIIGSAIIQAGSTNFGAAAATKLEFRVVPGPGPQRWSFPAWTWWALAAVIVVAAGVVVSRRSGLRIRIERTHTGRSRA